MSPLIPPGHNLGVAAVGIVSHACILLQWQGLKTTFGQYGYDALYSRWGSQTQAEVAERVEESRSVSGFCGASYAPKSLKKYRFTRR